MPSPTPLFTVQARFLDVSPYTVIAFSGHEALSQPFEWEVTLYGESVNNTDTWFQRTLSITINDGKNPARTVNGIIRSVTTDALPHSDNVELTVTLTPWLSDWQDTVQNRRFTQKTALDIIQTLVTQYPGATVRSALQRHYPPLAHVMQYNETDFDFFHRLLAQSGWHYHFDFTQDGQHSLILHDVFDSFMENRHCRVRATAQHADDMSDISTLSVQHTFIPPNHSVGDYDAMQNTALVSADARSHGRQLLYGVPLTHFTCPAGFQTTAPGDDTNLENAPVHAVLQQHIARAQQGQVSYQGTADNTRMCVGHLAVLAMETGSETVLIESVQHHGTAATPHATHSTPTPTHYHTTFTAFGNVNQRTPPLNKNEQKPQPLGGLHRVSMSEHQPNTQGGIQVNYPWQTDASAHPYRSLQLGASATRGFFALPRPGHELLVRYLDDNAERGVIMGGLFTQSPHDPISAHAQLSLTTPVSDTDSTHCHALHFNDTPGQTSLAIMATQQLLLRSVGDTTLHADSILHQAGQTLTQNAPAHTLTAKERIVLNSAQHSVQLAPGQLTLHSAALTITGPAVASTAPPLPLGIPPHLLANEPPVNTRLAVVTDVLYDTINRTFYALLPAQENDFVKACKPFYDAVLNLAIAQQHHANVLQTTQNSATSHADIEKADKPPLQDTINKAKEHLATLVNPYVSKDGNHSVLEFYSLKKSRWYYLPQTKIASNWFHYAVHAKNQSVLTYMDKLDDRQLKARLLPTEYDIKNCSMNMAIRFMAFAQSLGTTWEVMLFPEPDNKKVQFSHDAAFMRFTSGASLQFADNALTPIDKKKKWSEHQGDDKKDKEGKSFFSGESKMELALLDAKASITSYIPRASGAHVEFNCPKGDYVDFGYFRVMITLDSELFAGAKLNLSTALVAGVQKGDDVSKLGLTAKGSADFFAGVEVSCDIGCEISWQNPDNTTGKYNANQQPLTITSGDSKLLPYDPTQAWMIFASVDAKGSAALGAAIGGDFTVGYFKDRFVIHFKAHLVWGFGFGGEFTVVVEPLHILEFVAFIYHKMKDTNFRDVGYIAGEAYKRLIEMFAHWLLGDIATLEDVAKQTMKTLENWVSNLRIKMHQEQERLQLALTLATNLKKPDFAIRLKYSTPEVKGKMIYLLSDPLFIPLLEDQILAKYEVSDESKRSVWQTIAASSSTPGAAVGSMTNTQALTLANHSDELFANIQLLEEGILVMLSYIQSYPEYINVVQHMADDPTRVHDQEAGEKRLYNALGIYGRSQLKLLQQFKDALDDDNNKVIYPHTIEKNTPVKQNEAMLAMYPTVLF